MVTKKFGVDFDSSGGALTLKPEYVREKEEIGGGYHVTTHSNGWTILGYVQEDCYQWVNKFEAEHFKFGRVWGDFEDVVSADSEEGYQDFYRNFPPESWDYADN